MTPEIGHFALVIALCLAVVQGVLPVVGAQRGITQWMAAARPIAIGQFVFLAISFACLVTAFIQNDFTVLYVANNSNTALPLQYRISAVWGAHEGSLLLWSLILSGWTVAVVLFSRTLPMAMSSRVLGVMGLVSIGFLLFMLATSNPFDRVFPAPLEGRDLNPLLQDFGLIIHPPLLYMGYVGFSVAFSFAIAALLGGHLDAAWARWSRPWTLVAWLFLTLGIMLGSWWAYYELGWGGWWFWDPVENASFMPWLVGTALIHSLVVTESRGTFKSWTVLLAIFAFSLSLLGTFLVRSGVLVSVHAFATDPARGIFILGFLAAVIGTSLVLYAWRAPGMQSSSSFKLVSRESLLLLNNILLVTAAGTVLLGTIYPLVLDALGLGKISVGPPYFDAVFAPLMLPMVFAMGFAFTTRWKQDSPGGIVRRLRIPAMLSLMAGLAFAFLAAGQATTMVVIACWLAAWTIFTALQELWSRLRLRRQGRKVAAAVWGRSIAHIGVGVFIVGVAFVNSYEVEQDIRMREGGTVDIGGYTFRFDGVRDVQGPNYIAKQGDFTVTRDGEPVANLISQKRVYRVQTNAMTEAGIDPGFTRDLYVSLGEELPGGGWSVRVYYKPYIRWIWLGAILMALGGLLAAADRRYRIKARRVSEAPVAGMATAKTA
jgi:cytochrome c-type biogenesis protein CcmF